jgi:hypothetical protein
MLQLERLGAFGGFVGARTGKLGVLVGDGDGGIPAAGVLQQAASTNPALVDPLPVAGCLASCGLKDAEIHLQGLLLPFAGAGFRVGKLFEDATPVVADLKTARGIVGQAIEELAVDREGPF